MAIAAQEQQSLIRDWVRQELSSLNRILMYDRAGNNRGLAVFKRIIMMGAVSILPPDGISGLHFLDDETNAYILRKEMAINHTLFYQNVDLGVDSPTSWLSLIQDSNVDGLHRKFYRTHITRRNVYRPVLVSFMPDFQELLPADGSLDLNEVIYDEVLGSLGGTLNEINPADFSQDTSLASLTLTLDGVDEALTLILGQTAYTVTRPVATSASISAIATDSLSVVDVSDPIDPLMRGENILTVTVTAEQNQETVYTVTVVV